MRLKIASEPGPMRLTIGKPEDADSPNIVTRITCYDGQVECSVDGRSNVRCLEHDPRGWIRFVSEPMPDAGQACNIHAAKFRAAPDSVRRGLRYIYGPFGVVEQIIDTGAAAGTGTTLVDTTHDVFGRVLTTARVGRDVVTSGYNAFGELESTSDTEGDVILGYDKLSRLISRTAGADSRSWVWRRDLQGRLDYSTSGAIKKSVGYDPFGRTSSQSTVIDGEALTFSVEQRDVFGRPEVLVFPKQTGAPFKIKNSYDATNGQLVGVHSVPATGSNEPAFAYWQLSDIDETGQKKKELFDDGRITTTRTYFPFSGRPKTVSTVGGGITLQGVTYAYDHNGNVASRADTVATREETFVYDTEDRLDEVWLNGAKTADPSYTAFGSLETNLHGATYGYEAGRPYAVHDFTVGNESSIFEYDDAGKLRHRTQGALPELNVEYTSSSKVQNVWGSDPGLVTTLRYDAEDTKVAKAWSTGSEVYFEDVYYRLTPTAGTPEEHFVIHNDERIVAEVTIGGPNAGVVFHHDDLIGSSQVLSHSGNTGAEFRNFELFGSHPAAGTASQFGFGGHRDEGDQGLIDMRGRTYDPLVGQFLSMDPVIASPFNRQTFNSYTYGLNNPLRFIDPSGFQVCDNLSSECGGGGTTGSGALTGAEGSGSPTGFGVSSLSWSPSVGEMSVPSGGPLSSSEERAYSPNPSATSFPRASNTNTWSADGGGGGATSAGSPNVGSMGQSATGLIPSADGGEQIVEALAWLPGLWGAPANGAQLAEASIAGNKTGIVIAAVAMVGGKIVAKLAAKAAARGAGAADEAITLYRGVGPNELRSVQEAGKYAAKVGGTEGKYFFETPEQVSNFARMMGDKAYTTTSVRVSASELAGGQAIRPAGEGAGYFFPAGQLPAGPVTIWNFSVLP
jgi:RHS repeat-associated protein